MDKPDNQVLYNGKWTPKAHFRAFVYNNTGFYLAKNYEEYSRLLSSGTWFSEPQPIIPNDEKVKVIKGVMEVTKDDNEKVVSMHDAERGKKCRNQAKT